MKPDFNVEEKISIEKDSREISDIIREMGECLPKEDPDKGSSSSSTLLTKPDGRVEKGPLG